MQVLGHLGQTKAKCLSKGNRETMNGHFQVRGGRGTRIASKALIPCQTPMSALCAGDNGSKGRRGVIFGWGGFHRQGNHFGPYQLHPAASELTTWPITPQERERQSRFSRLGLDRWRGHSLIGEDWKDHGTDASWLDGPNRFLTLCPQRTGAAMANAGGIEHA